MGQEWFSHSKKGKLLVQMALQNLENNRRNEIEPGGAQDNGQPKQPD